MAYLSILRRSIVHLILSSALVACTADSLVPPAGVDRGERVGAVQQRPVPQAAAQQYAYEGGPAPGSPNTPNQAAQPARLAMAGEVRTSGSLQAPGVIPPEGVNMDAELGVGDKQVVGLAQEEAQNIAEGESDEPVVDGIGTDNPAQLNQSFIPRSSVQAQLRQRTVLQQGQQVAMLPRLENPITRPAPPVLQEPMQTPVPLGAMPASEQQCRQELRGLGVLFEDKAPIYDGPACQVPYPISLRGLSGDINVRPAVTLNCQLTLAFARWVKNELAPAARLRYWSGIGTIVPLGGYSCRRMNNSSQRYNPMSEHAHGNAIDVGTFVLKNGHVIDVRRKGLFSFREGLLLKAVRTDSCRYFDTVLGPGSNPEHWNHFHFDLRDRHGGRRYCSL
jgi:hypothetical protein